MVISDDKILTLLQKPLNDDAITSGAKLQNDHKVHITGEGYESLIKQVQGFEGSNDFNVRKQISKPATMQITSIILDNLNRWVNAQGTVKKADFKDDKKNALFDEILNQCWNNSSFDYFIRSFYKEAIYTDFNGFILITKPKIIDGGLIEKEGIVKPNEGGALKPYMIFISISDIHDFFTTGDKIEYLIIKLNEEKTKFRIIDDQKDMIITYTNGEIDQRDEIKNELGYVPAIKLSNLNKNILSSQVKTSPIGHVVPALDRYFSSDCDLRMQMIKHAYPKLAIVTRECKLCNGTGSVFDEAGTKLKCNTCDGIGKEIPISRDGVIGIPDYLRQGDTAFPGAPASYINPEVESLKICIEDLEKQRKDILYSATGDKGLISEQIRDETATSSMISSRSLEDRIAEISSMVEDFEMFCKKALKDSHQELQQVEDYSITVKYGRRVAIKGETEIIEEITKSKTAGMPVSYIQALQRDLIFAKYKNNVSEQERQLLLADVEPFCGYTVNEVLILKDTLDPLDLYIKVNFDTLIDQFEQETPVQYFEIDKGYKERVNLIKQKLEENAILQRTQRAGQVYEPPILGASQNDAS